MPFSDPVRTLIDELIESQHRLDTPVMRASALHDQIINRKSEIVNYSGLIPLTAPGPGEQYAFQVDLDSCSGCKACVAGCHSLNGLDENETWRDVGLVLGSHSASSLPNVGRQLAGAPIPSAYQQTITTACHHCEDPACLSGCPVLAYEKDPVTGIVVHLDDQCIGCSYCVLKCPYDVPKYNERLGIVRKCDMCHGRLSAGEAPACVQACPTQAITIIKVSTHHSSDTAPSEPSSPSSTSAESSTGCGSNCSCKPHATAVIELPVSRDYTRPTTRYVSKNPLPANLRAADATTLRPQHAHAALILLLVFTQVGLGLLLSASFVGRELARAPVLPAQIINDKSLILNLLGLAFFTGGLIASIAHLGQPFRAWRIFLGLRRSWLSREAVLLGTAFPLLVAASASEWIPKLALHLPAFLEPLHSKVAQLLDPWWPLIALSGLAIAALGVFCSAMIYIDTRRRFWRPTQSLGRMVGTTLITALAGLSVATSASEWSVLASAALALKLLLELTTLSGSGNSARLQRGPLRSVLVIRLLLAAGALGLFALNAPWIALAWFILGELAERTLFFQAVDSPKMPGMPA